MSYCSLPGGPVEVGTRGRRCLVACQLFGCGKDNRGWTAVPASQVSDEAVAIVLRSAIPIETYTVVARLATTFAIVASWLLFTTITAVRTL
jgi:hypothetical protein